jgi:hypothetical protein
MYNAGNYGEAEDEIEREAEEGGYECESGGDEVVVVDGSD